MKIRTDKGFTLVELMVAAALARGHVGYSHTIFYCPKSIFV